MVLKYDIAFLTITDKCGYACKHCYSNSGPKADRMMSPDVFEKTIDIYKKNSTDRRIVRFSGGDPLFHPQFKDYVAHTIKEIPDAKIDVLTTDYSFKRNPEAFKKMVQFLQQHNLRFLSFNSDYDKRAGTPEDLMKVTYFCRELAQQGNPFISITSSPVSKPHHIGRANKLSLYNSDKSKRAGCDKLKFKVSEDNLTFPMNVNINGDLQYCLFGIGAYANVTQEWKDIERALLGKTTFRTLQTENGIEKILNISGSKTNKYDHLPANCSRLQAVLEDNSLAAEIERALIESE